MWKKRWLILRQKSSKGLARIEKYHDEASSYDSSQAFGSTVVELRYISDIQRKEESVKKHGIVIHNQTTTAQFSADSGLCSISFTYHINQIVISIITI